MPRPLLLDTHVFAWAQLDPARLSARAREAIEQGDAIFVSAISFFEIAHKARLGKWPEIAPVLPRLRDIHERQGGCVAEIDGEIAEAAGTLDWPHRDPFDRLIAATARKRKYELVSADTAFDAVLERVW